MGDERAGSSHPRPPRLRARWLLLCALVAGPSAPALTAAPSPRAALADTPAPATTGSGEWPNGGRFLDAGNADTSRLANDVYADHIPPELLPSLLVFQKVASGGFQAELDFPAPVMQLHWYLNQDSGDDGDAGINGSVPVRHTVDLVLQPPSGAPTTVSLQADGRTVVTREGAQIGSGRTVFAGTRLIMSVPASAGVQDSWTVQAVIRLASDQPLNSSGGGVHLPATLSAATEPALVGVLTGDDAGAPEPFSGGALLHTGPLAVQSPDTQHLPDGGRPTALHLEQGPRGLVAVVTLDSPPKPSTGTVGGQPVNQEQLSLSLAPGVQDGLGIGRVRVDWFYPACGRSTCPPTTTAAVTLAGQYLGTIPVSVAGKDVRFDFSSFTAYKAPSQPAQATPSGSVLGTFTKTVTAAAEDLDVIPLGSAPAPAPESTTWSVDGTDISIRRGSESTPATGSINPFTGYFFASNAQEMWSGFLGKEGWYSQLPTVQPTAAHLARPGMDIDTPQKVQTLANYLWIQKKAEEWEDEYPGIVKWFLAAAGTGFSQPDTGPAPPAFVRAVAGFLRGGGTFDKDTLAKAFPNGYDPIVVSPPAAIPFALSSVLPGLSPQGAQWEIAVGMTVLDRTSQGMRWQSPYVPASSLLSGRPASGGSSATPARGAEAAASTGGGGGIGVVVAIVIIVLVVAGGAAVWLRRRRAGTTA